MAESDPADRSSVTQHLVRSATDILKSKLYQTLTFKDLSFDQYRILLTITLGVNIVFLGLQVGRLGYLMVRNTIDDALSLLIIAGVLTTINILHILKLMFTPTPRTAVSCMGIILVQEVIFISETFVYYKYAKGEDYVIALSVIFLFLQLISVVVVYRFWELILFNYDDSTWDANGSPSDLEGGAPSVAGGRKSMGNSIISMPGKPMRSPIHIENS